jgi:hypothetical protein
MIGIGRRIHQRCGDVGGKVGFDGRAHNCTPGSRGANVWRRRANDPSGLSPWDGWKS